MTESCEGKGNLCYEAGKSERERLFCYMSTHHPRKLPRPNSACAVCELESARVRPGGAGKGMSKALPAQQSFYTCYCTAPSPLFSACLPLFLILVIPFQIVHDVTCMCCFPPPPSRTRGAAATAGPLLAGKCGDWTRNADA